MSAHATHHRACSAIPLAAANALPATRARKGPAPIPSETNQRQNPPMTGLLGGTGFGVGERGADRDPSRAGQSPAPILFAFAGSMA